MDKLKSFYVGSLSLFLIASCGGGGGGGGSDAPAPVPTPTVTISASPTEVLLSESTTITWSSTNASSCSANGGWTNATTSSGSASVTITSTGSNTFTISCSGDGGSRSASVTVEGYRNTDGVVVDGYISGSSVFIDENDNWTEDTSENSTTSDNEGKFTIKYADGYLVSIGGTDLDSQILLDNYLITHKLDGHSDFKVISPVTSIMAFADSIDMKEALGIDSSIDVRIFDPVANKGDGGINDFLYEKGNQLTVLAYALQNLTNDLNTSSETTQSFFKAIAEEIEKEYSETSTKVDIESSAFADKALTNIISAKSLTVSDTTKSNIISALSSVLPVVQIKSSDDLTTAVIRFAVSTFQNDIKAIANETASESIISSYKTDILNYIATDQSIDGDKIAPSITAVNDSASTDEDTSVEIPVIANDSYLTSSPISVSANNGDYGITSVSSNIVTYSPDSDSCQDDTFTYTIQQGDKTSSASVNVTVNCINDSPSIDIASTINVSENETFVAKVGVSDPDISDNLELTLGGTDSNSFNLSADYNLSFKEAPDYETKNSYSISLNLTDGTLSVSKDLTINVLNVNEAAPTITSNAVFSAEENQTSIGTVTASDADGDAITFSVSGSEIQISPSGGVLSFVEAPNYEAKSSYSATVTATDGSKSSTQNITINIIDISEVTTFNGKAIDGYISGADIFIDQNFNFKYDSGEYSSKTKADGSFEIEVEDTNLVACLENRPIIADVPVGAEDSTLGTVETAYQMILPSIKDSGTTSIVISPFTSLFSEAILSAKSNLKEDLDVAEGCSSEGDSIASSISSRINELKATLTNTFSIDIETMTGDFIISNDSKINETSAQNIAKLLPYLRIIDNQVSDALTAKFGKEIRANVSLSESALNIIFGGSSYEKLPLDFKSIYRTDANSSGWYQEEVLQASGAFISNTGVLSRADCSETDTELCNITDLTLKNIANASTSFAQDSNFFKTNIDFDAIGIKAGSLAVTASDRRSWRNNSANWQDKNNRDRECQWDNAIQFQNTVVAGTQSNFRYSSYSQGYEKADCESVRHYYYPILSVSTIPDQSVNDNSLELRYYIPDITRSGISDNLPYDFITNRVTIDPLEMVKDIADLPRTFKELDAIRRMFNGEDYVFYEYNKDSNLNAYFEAGTNPRNDMYWDRTEGSHDRIYGQAARDAFYNRIIQETTFTEDITGSSAPINSSILGRIANSYIEIVDYVGSDEVKIPVYPTYDSTSKNLDFTMSGASIDLENLHDFIENGINSTPISVNLWYSPDDSIAKTVPVKLYLYEGNDTNVDAGESFFTITFDLEVSSQEGSEENPVGRTASQTWSVPKDQTIEVKYQEGDTELIKTITNNDLDQIILTDGGSSDLDDYKVNKPSTLDAKILQLISNIDENIDGIKNFFVDEGIYTIKLDLGSGGHSMVSYYRNIVDTITGTFSTKSSPTYPISVNDMRINEGETKDLCFYRPSVNTASTSFNLSFTQRERPGKGGLADDFSLSSTTITFAEEETQKCVEITASTDTHFDWVHDIYLDISTPSNGQALSRNRVKISILDSYGYQNRISWKAR